MYFCLAWESSGTLSLIFLRDYFRLCALVNDNLWNFLSQRQSCWICIRKGSLSRPESIKGYLGNVRTWYWDGPWSYCLMEMAWRTEWSMKKVMIFFNSFLQECEATSGLSVPGVQKLSGNLTTDTGWTVRLLVSRKILTFPGNVLSYIVLVGVWCRAVRKLLSKITGVPQSDLTKYPPLISMK